MAQRTPGHGVWNHANGNIYHFSFKIFSFDAGNNFTGRTKITHEAALDSNGDQCSSAGTSEIFAPNGTLGRYRLFDYDCHAIPREREIGVRRITSKR